MSARAAIEGDYRSRQIVAAILVDILDNQDDGGHVPCAIAVATCLQILVGTKSATEFRYLRRAHPEVIRACLRFLMRPRNAAQTSTLVKILQAPAGQCACMRSSGLHNNPLLDDIHRPAALGLDPPSMHSTYPAMDKLFETVTVNLVGILSHTFYSTTALKLMLQANRAGRRRRDSPWPSRLEDIFPFGINESLVGLCSWSQYFPNGVIMRLAEDLFSRTDTHLSPGLLLRVIIPMTFMPTIQKVLDDHHASHDSPSLQRVSMVVLNTAYRPLERLLRMDNPQIKYAIGDKRAEWVNFVSLAVRAQRTIDTLGPQVGLSDQMREIFSVAAGRLHYILRIPHGGALDLLPSDLIEYAGRGWDDEAANPFSCLSSFLRYLNRGIRCARRGCIHVPISIGRKLRVCGGCRQIYYCSEACQTAAWASDVSPHKSICRALRSVTATVEASGERLDSIRRDDFRDICKRERINPGPIADIARDLMLIYGE